jgi:hypothetical protein
MVGDVVVGLPVVRRRLKSRLSVSYSVAAESLGVR